MAHESPDKLMHRRGAHTVQPLDELARDVLDTDEEHDEFLGYTYAARHGSLG